MMRAVHVLVSLLLLSICHASSATLGFSPRTGRPGRAVETNDAKHNPRKAIINEHEAENLINILKSAFQWNFSDSTNSGARVSDVDWEALHGTAAGLHQIIDTTKVLLGSLQRCNSSTPSDGVGNEGRPAAGGATSSEQREGCPAPAPELLQGGTAAFLTTFIRNYPLGPTSSEALAGWAVAANTFLQEHRRMQREQRQQWLEAMSSGNNGGVNSGSGSRRTNQEQSGPIRGDEVREQGGGPTRQVQGTSTLRRLLAESFEPVKRDGDTSSSSIGDQISSTSSSDTVDVPTEDFNESSSSELDGNDGGGGDTSSDDKDDQPGMVSGDDVSASTPALDVKYGGLPLVRRLLLAHLLLGWINGLHRHLGGKPRPMAEEVLQLVTQLYEIHVESVVQRGIIQYFHISKAGGTSWGTAARSNLCSTSLRSTVREFDDECRWINGTVMREVGGVPVKTDPGHRQVCSRFDVLGRMSEVTDCAGRLRFARDQGYNYVANEYTLTGGLHDMYGTRICPQFVNVISIREPLSRLVSNLKYMILRLRSVLFPGPDALGQFRQLFCNASAATWETFAPPVADNYNVRSLIGERGFHTPLYGIGEAHEAVAKQLLAQYDLILDLGAGEGASEVLMRMGLGWNQTLAEVHAWSTKEVAHSAGVDLNRCGLGDLQPLLSRQVHDERWYRFGVALSQLDQFFLSMVTQMGLEPNAAGSGLQQVQEVQPPRDQPHQQQQEEEEEEEEGEEGEEKKQPRHTQPSPGEGEIYWDEAAGKADGGQKRLLRRAGDAKGRQRRTAEGSTAAPAALRCGLLGAASVAMSARTDGAAG